MIWPSITCSSTPAFTPWIVTEPKIISSGGVRYRHYLITAHAVDRYMERIGGDVGNLIADLDSAWLFDINRAGLRRRDCAPVARTERDGGYALSDGRVLFIVKPGERIHFIVTTLLTHGKDNTLKN
ncbi:TPA: hypothetical protein ACP41M_001091 [Klebsiella aerogenes]